MRVRDALQPAHQLSFFIVAVTILILIISTALAHLVPLQSVDGASHVAGITNPATGSAVELLAASEDKPAPAHHEHFEIDRDGTVPRAMDTVGSVAEVPPLLSSLASPERTLVSAELIHRDLPGPSLVVLSISRT
ncbi:hypothetical protein [Herbiconiux sp. YIM B11900]|uniref:hypothetical protein n=1 Tax=Herbiconiux sp. YIM B11900 TaxID=3404131 RepID=UPI003F82AA5A